MNDADILRKNTRLLSQLQFAVGNVHIKETKFAKPVIQALTLKGIRANKSALILLKEGDEENAGILLRSMLNLLISATWIWAFEDKRDYRAQLYVDYQWIERREIQETFAWAQQVVEKSPILVADKGLMKIYTEAERVQRVHGFKFGRGFSKKSIKRMAGEVSLLPHYKFVYQFLSISEHSGPSSSVGYLKRTPDGVVAQEQPNEWMRSALCSTSYEMLLLLSKLANDALSLGIKGQIDALYEEFHKRPRLPISRQEAKLPDKKGPK